MNLDKMRELYNECEKMTIEEYSELMYKTIDQQEQDFYNTVFNFMLQRRQKEIINKPFIM